MAPPPPDSKTPPRPGTLGRNPAPGPGAGGRLAGGFRVGAPSVSLPKGGGSISGIGEKVSANPVTGSGSLSIPLPLTPGRSGFTPGLSLSYSSGGGNGPFGHGWQLGLPSVRRKTDRGLPRYLDLGEKADTYVLSDVEDLVPLLVLDGEDWIPVTREVADGDDTWTVQRFRPRIEGAFALIEQYRRQGWRVFSSGKGWRPATARLVTPDPRTLAHITCQSQSPAGSPPRKRACARCTTPWGRARKFDKHSVTPTISPTRHPEPARTSV